jgi:hypothetical protein
VSYGKACARVDWDGGGLVMAAHGRAVRGRSKRRRRRWNVGQVLEIGYWNWQNSIVGVEVMPLRARDRKLWLCGERSTATARWRPGGGDARVASVGDAREGGEQRWWR